MMSYFSPKPRQKPKRLPRRKPIKVVPSGIGDKGLVGNWLFYYLKGGDHLHDFSPYDNHGTLKNDPVWKDGRYGWALEFDGVDDYVLLPSFSTFSEFTLIIWSRHHSVSDGDYDVDFVLRKNNGFLMRDMGDGTLGIYIYDGTWDSISTSISNNVWNMWTERYDGSVMEVFKNDESIGSISSGHVADGSDEHAIGSRDPVGGQYLDGEVALCWLFNTAKPDSFIKRRYHKTKSIFGK